MKMSDVEFRIILAVQQMVAFNIGKWSRDPIELVEQMGLTKTEWYVIKSQEDAGSLDDEDIAKIDNYFEAVK